MRASARSRSRRICAAATRRRIADAHAERGRRASVGRASRLDDGATVVGCSATPDSVLAVIAQARARRVRRSRRRRARRGDRRLRRAARRRRSTPQHAAALATQPGPSARRRPGDRVVDRARRPRPALDLRSGRRGRTGATSSSTTCTPRPPRASTSAACATSSSSASRRRTTSTASTAAAASVPGDERIFVLADVRGRSAPTAARSAAHHRRLRARLPRRDAHAAHARSRTRDPQRRLQWNRIVDRRRARGRARADDAAAPRRERLAPATHHLGLEKRRRAPDAARSASTPERRAAPIEVVITDVTGAAPRRRRARAARRQPLRPGDRLRAQGRRGAPAPPRLPVRDRAHARPAATAREPAALGASRSTTSTRARRRRARCSVAGRAPGQNTSADRVRHHHARRPTRCPEGMRARAASCPIRRAAWARSRRRECDRIVRRDRSGRAAARCRSSGCRSRAARASPWTAAPRTSTRPRAWCAASSPSRSSGGVIHVHRLRRQRRRAELLGRARDHAHAHARRADHDAAGVDGAHRPRGARGLGQRRAPRTRSRIGGYERVMGPNGEAQYYARDLVERLPHALRALRFTYVVPGRARAAARCRPTTRASATSPTSPYRERRRAGFRTVGEIFDDETNPGRKRPFAMRARDARAWSTHDGGYLERWRAMVGAETAIVWDAHLGGHPVCLIGIESQNVAARRLPAARRPERVERRHALPAVVEEGRARAQRGERQSPGGDPRQPLRLRRLARVDAQAAARVRRRDRARGGQLRRADRVPRRVALPRRRLRRVLARAQRRPARARRSRARTRR